MNAPSVEQRVRSGKLRVTLFLALQLALMVGWALVLSTFQEGDVYAFVGPFALGVICVLVWFRRQSLAQVLRPTSKNVAAGLIAGIAMTAITYPVYELAVLVMPQLESQVGLLYRGAEAAPLREALPWTLVILVAEEILWRGTLLTTLARLVPIGLAAAVSVLCYAAAQLGSGSLIVALAAVVCGTLWIALRIGTKSLVAPLIAHAVWTPVVILLWPLVG